MTTPRRPPLDPRLLRRSPAARRYIALSVALAAALAACTIAIAWSSARILASLITDETQRSFEAQRTALAVLVVAAACRTGLHFVRERYGRRAAQAVIADLRAHAVDALTDPRRTPPRTLARLRDHAATVLLRGLDDLSPYLSGYVPALVLSVVVTPLMVLVIALVDVPSAIIVVVTLPLIPVFMILIGVMTRDATRAKLAATSALSGQLLDLVAGLPTLRALHRVHGATAQLTRLGTAWRRATMGTLRIAFLSGAVLELLATLCVALVAVGIGVRLVYGEMSLYAAIFALILAPEVYLPLRQVGAQFHNSQDGLEAVDDLFELIGPEPASVGGSLQVELAGASIDIDGLRVRGRDGDAPAGLSTAIEPGRLSVWHGPNGAGKSTALAVLLGLVDDYEGCVRVGGVSLRDLDADHLRTQVAWLSQHPAILPGTVASNLVFFGAADAEQLAAAAATTGFDEVVAGLEDGYDCMLGAGGAGLSAGQRQRLGLTRALASSAPLLLLDEPTAHLDPAAEQAVIATVARRVAAGATVIVVSHRQSWRDAADHVIEFGAVGAQS